jgi:hypothetical protein
MAALDASTGTATAWNPNVGSNVNAIAVSGSTVYVGGIFTFVNGSTTRNRIAALDASTGTATAWNPNLNGTVNALAVSGSTVYAGGSFSSVNGSTPRNNGAAIDAATGIATSWNPNFNNTVLAFVVSGSTVYAGGSFSSLNAQSRGNLAALDLTTGQVTAWNPNVAGQVLAVAVDGSTVYAGGRFTAANGGKPRNRIAAFSASTGTLTGWNPNASAQVNALLVSGSNVYAGGTFATIGGQSRFNIAALDAGTGLATSWRPRLDAGVGALALHPSGSTIYAGGSFTTASQSVHGLGVFDASSGSVVPTWPETDGNVYTVAPDGAGGWFIGGLFTQVGGLARTNLAHILSDMSVAAWAPNPNSAVQQLAVSVSTVYVVGNFGTIGGQSRNYLAAVDASTGLATSWNPNPSNPVNAIAVSGGLVYVGGGFSTIGGQTRSRIAALDPVTGLATGWNPGLGGISPSVTALAVSGTTVYASGDFTFVGFDPRTRLAAIDATTGAATGWNPGADGTALAMVVSDTTLYVGGFFGSIGGATRSRIAALSTSTGLATAWDPNSNAGVRAIAVNGSTIYVGGDFFGSTAIGGQPRLGVAAIDATTGLATSWDAKLDATDVNALALNGSTLFVGGQFMAAGAQTRKSAAAFDATTGLLLGWNPNASNGAVYALAASASAIYAGGFFTVIGGQNRGFLAALDPFTGSATAWNPNPGGLVEALAVTGTTVYAGGATFSYPTPNYLAAFSVSDGTLLPSNPVPFGGDAPSPGVYALARGATTLYAGGSFKATGNQPQTNVAAIEDDPPPNLQTVSPAIGGDSGPVTLTIGGHRLWNGATAKLTRSGQPDIPGTGVTVAADSLTLTATFDIGGKLKGAWNVVVTNPDLQTATLPNGFTIGTFEAPQLRVDVVGPAAFRTGYPASYDLVIQNPGNVDVLDVPLWIAGIPTTATVGLDFTLASPAQDAGEPDWTQLPDTLTTAAGRYLALVIPRVPPGTVTRRVLLSVPSTPSFSLTAALTPPWVDGTQLRTCLADGGVIENTACLGTQLTAINAYLANHPEIEALNGIGLWAKVGWQCEGGGNLDDALGKARQVLGLMVGPVEQQGTVPPSCSEALATRWRQVVPVTVGGSIDPNDKFGEVGLGASITTQTWLPYTIQFENASTALYPAQHVIVSDALDSDLDPATVSLGRITFGSYHVDPPPASHTYATVVSIGPI